MIFMKSQKVLEACLSERVVEVEGKEAMVKVHDALKDVRIFKPTSRLH